MFQTKDSGKRATYESGMVRDTEEGKARFDLLLPKDVPFEQQMLTRFARLMERGAVKYDERNWEKAEGQVELDRYHSSALRHLVQWLCGADDEDHAAAVLFNILAGETVKYKMTQSENAPKILEPEYDERCCSENCTDCKSAEGLCTACEPSCRCVKDRKEYYDC